MSIRSRSGPGIRERYWKSSRMLHVQLSGFAGFTEHFQKCGLPPHVPQALVLGFPCRDQEMERTSCVRHKQYLPAVVAESVLPASMKIMEKLRTKCYGFSSDSKKSRLCRDSSGRAAFSRFHASAWSRDDSLDTCHCG
jgi:hypothetical protein